MPIYGDQRWNPEAASSAQWEPVEQNRAVVVRAASPPLTATGATDAQVNRNFKGVKIYLKVQSLNAGTLDAKVQTKDPASGDWADLAGASWPQKNAVDAVADPLTIYPGIAETANESVSDIIGRDWRVHFTLAGGATSALVTVGAHYIG